MESVHSDNIQYLFIYSNMLRLGVDLGEIKQLLHVYPLLNREYLNTGDGKLTLTKNWSKIAVAIAPITVIEHLNVFATDLERFKRFEDVFTKGSTVFLMNKGFYGCQATIFDSKFISGRIKCKFYTKCTLYFRGIQTQLTFCVFYSTN